MYTDGSLSARRAWIEIIDDLEPSKTRRVALRKESVDRNMSEDVSYSIIVVALRKESVDRNSKRLCNALKHLVALRKESVDRNYAKETPPHRTQSRSPQGERG